MAVLKFDELHRLSKQIYEETEDLPKEEKKKKAYDEILDLLIMAYVFGWDRVDPTEDAHTDSMFEAIFYLIDGKTFEDRINEHIDKGDWEEEVIQRLVETEYHRVEETGAFDSATNYERKTGKTAYKKWVTMQDERVRDTHFYLEGTEVLLTGRFYTFDGDSAGFPGGFKKPENNINCRCELAYSFR